MDYKYIEQLLERYWECTTSLEEENILRTFFRQKDVPASLLQYKALFTYEQTQKEEEVLGEEFDRKMMEMIDEPTPVKARTIHLTQRLMPLFKAAAVVAIILTLGNAAQVAFNQEDPYDMNMAEVQQPSEGPSVAAVSDSLKVDTLKKAELPVPAIIK
ncbi:MAG: pyruvate ferredoxin oxidoreductase [Prevotella sp.]|nr:pyruvate ferredoxin oxidoreductase [Prevotella sp.]